MFTVMTVVLTAMTGAILCSVISGTASAWVTSLCTTIRQKLCSQRESSNDEVGLRLHTHMMGPKVNQFRLLLQLMNVGTLPYNVLMIVNIATGSPRLNSMNSDMVQVAFQTIFALPVVHPNCVSSKTIDIFYGVLMVMCSLVPFAYPSPDVLTAIMGANVVALMLTLARRSVRGRVALMFSCNLTYACATAVALLMADGFVYARFLSTIQIVGITAECIGAHMLERSLEASMLNTLQLEEVKEIHSAACAIMRSCCEVVVELDAEGVITSPTRELGSFLLRETAPGLTHLADLIVHDDERSLFSHRLGSHRLRQIGLAENMQVSMRDACGNLLRLELLWFQFHRWDGTVSYMVGLREFKPFSMEPAAREATGPVRAASASSTSLPETASVTSSSVEGTAAMAIIDCSGRRPGCPIRGLNDEFCMRIGRLPLNEPLDSYVTQAEEFVNWTQAAVGNLMAGSQPVVPFHRVTLKMPQGHMRAKCRIVSLVGQPGEEEADFDAYEVPVVFFNIAPVRAHASLPMSALRGTPPCQADMAARNTALRASSPSAGCHSSVRL